MNFIRFDIAEFSLYSISYILLLFEHLLLVNKSSALVHLALVNRQLHADNIRKLSILHENDA